MGAACNTHGRKSSGVYGVLGGGGLNERDHLGDSGVDWRIILK
jgi:hypothetical protein